MIEQADGRHLLFIVGNHRVLRIGAATAARLRDGLDALTENEVRDWNALVTAGVIEAVNPIAAAAAHWSDGANLAINVNLTAACNLDCSYCFADGGDYGRIKGRLQAETVPQIFDFVAAHLTPSRTVRFEFFGGEPLLNLERIAEICDHADRLRRASSIQSIFRISTNLTYLPPEALELLVARRFIVSVSIDGGQRTHDRNRPTKTGQGSFSRILDNCRRLRAASDDVLLVARMTVLGGEPTLLEDVRELWSYNLFDYFQIYPAVVPAEKLTRISRTRGAASAHLSSGFMPQFLELVAAYPELFRPDNRFRGVLEYERIAELLLRGKIALAFCSGGRNYFTFSPDASIMPCHRLVGDTRFQVGTAARGLVDEPVAWRLPVDANPVCSRCWARYVCGGGCKQENLVATGDLTAPNPELCAYQTRMLESVIQVIARGDEGYAERSRDALDDLFVSCGRPVADAGRRHAGAVNNATFELISKPEDES
ncbi:MAG TPA: radical SAM protein [Kofleriaceae bacterium]|nr:radical SAM protein [Kofleriaceae bacterium]